MHAFDCVIPEGHDEIRKSKVGLHISNRICESLGGTISIISRPDIGSHVRFTMRVYLDLKSVHCYPVSSGSGEQYNFSQLLASSRDEQIVGGKRGSPSDDSTSIVDINGFRQKIDMFSVNGEANSSDMQSQSDYEYDSDQNYVAA